MTVDDEAEDNIIPVETMESALKVGDVSKPKTSLLCISKLERKWKRCSSFVCSIFASRFMSHFHVLFVANDSVLILRRTATLGANKAEPR